MTAAIALWADRMARAFDQDARAYAERGRHNCIEGATRKADHYRSIAKLAQDKRDLLAALSKLTDYVSMHAVDGLSLDDECNETIIKTQRLTSLIDETRFIIAQHTRETDAPC